MFGFSGKPVERYLARRVPPVLAHHAPLRALRPALRRADRTRPQPTPGRLVRRDVVHVQDLLNNIVNLAEQENAHLFLPLGRREQNDSRDHGANVRENVAEFVWRARHKFDHNAPYLGAKTQFVLRRIA
jgi:hypothetical protein